MEGRGAGMNGAPGVLGEGGAPVQGGAEGVEEPPEAGGGYRDHDGRPAVVHPHTASQACGIFEGNGADASPVEMLVHLEGVRPIPFQGNQRLPQRRKRIAEDADHRALDLDNNSVRFHLNLALVICRQWSHGMNLSAATKDQRNCLNRHDVPRVHVSSSLCRTFLHMYTPK